MSSRNIDMIKSLTQYRKDYKKSVEDPKEFWLRYSKSFLWSKVPKDILSWNFEDPDVKWFADGKMNITENIFERNRKNESDTAIIWEPNEPNEKNIELSYSQLFKRVCSFANVLSFNSISFSASCKSWENCRAIF